MAEKKSIAVIGAGTMGAGIAAQYAMYGHPVTLYSRTEQTLTKARKTIEQIQLLMEKEGVVNAAQPPLTSLVECTTSLEEAVKQAWYVVETIAEKQNAKKALFTTLDELLDEDVIISSNTSYMDIFQLLPPRRQSHGIIVHWFAPAHILPLVEVVKGPQTSREVVNTVMQLHKNCGKTPVFMERYTPGFIINRLQGAMNREVLYLLENNLCSPEDIDLAVKTSLMPRGMLLGLIQRMDFAGIDVVANGLRNKTYTPAPEPKDDNLLYSFVEDHRLGVKNGRGFYSYDHLPYEEVLALRDAQLLKSVRLAKQLMQQPLQTPGDKA